MKYGKGFVNTCIDIGLTGILALGSAGCSYTKYEGYEYEGKIGADKVKFQPSHYALFGSNNNIMTVTKPDGRVITFEDFNNDLKLYYIEITKNGKTVKYDEEPVLEEAQKKFDSYFSAIKKAKEAKEDNLKKAEEARIKQVLEDLK